jgi:bidirectional [NiFe] hydrogenase diaphorase subunit
MKITIDGKIAEVGEGASIMEAAQQVGVEIPNLCYNAELSPAGACRLCVVEVTENSDKSKGVLKCACESPVLEGMTVVTSSPRVIEARKLAAEMLLAQQPQSPKLKQIAYKLGLEKARYNLPQQNCILCQLCTRTCHEVTAAGAITLVNQGLNSAGPAHVVFDEGRCIACGSCAYVCPTGAVTLQDVGDRRIIDSPTGKMEFKLRACTKCGQFYAPEKQLEYLARRSGLPIEKFELCPDCR